MIERPVNGWKLQLRQTTNEGIYWKRNISSDARTFTLRRVYKELSSSQLQLVLRVYSKRDLAIVSHDSIFVKLCLQDCEVCFLVGGCLPFYREKNSCSLLSTCSLWYLLVWWYYFTLISSLLQSFILTHPGLITTKKMYLNGVRCSFKHFVKIVIR